MLVEDNPADKYFFEVALEDIGIKHQLLWLNDGAQAIEYFQECTPSKILPDFLFLDLSLPRRSGIEVLQFFRQRNVFDLVPVYMLSSSDDPGDIRKARTLGVQDYIVKPMDLFDLSRRLSMVFKSKVVN